MIGPDNPFVGDVDPAAVALLNEHEDRTGAVRRREEQILSLRNQGWSDYLIASKLRLTEKGVRQALQAAVDARREWSALSERLRVSTELDDVRVEYQRNLTLIDAELSREDLRPSARGSLLRQRREHLDSIVELSNRRAKLLGLDAPQVISATIEHIETSPIDQAVIDLVAQVEARNADLES